MPELPEVETVVRGLRKTIKGKTFNSARVLHVKPLTNLTPSRFRAFIRNETIREVERFGKYIHIQLETGKSLVCHLRMTGKFIYIHKDALHDEDMRHIRVAFTFRDGSLLFFKDVRIFGTIRAYLPHEEIIEKRRTGVEPFSSALTPAYLLSKASGRGIGLKVFLLDQSVIAGLGNIYACEILFHCRLDPFMETNKLQFPQAKLLIQKTKEVLKEAIRHNGTSIRDFKNIDSKSGNFQNWLQVYGRKGLPCKRCSRTMIRRELQAQRATFFCPYCQS